MREDDEEVDIGSIRFPMALRIASVFRVVAGVSLVGGLLATLAGGINLGQETDAFGSHVHTGAAVVGYVLAGFLSSLIVASFFAFFGYVLEILVEIYSDTWRLRIAMEPDDDDDDD